MNRTRSRRISLLVLAFFPLFLAAGPVLSARGVKVTMREKNIRDLSSTGLKLVFTMGVSNQETAPRRLVRYDYRVEVNQREYFRNSVVLDTPIDIPADAESFIGLPVRITYSHLEAAVGGLGTGGVCEVRGSFYFKDEKDREEKSSFSATGDFPIFKEPTTVVKPLRLNDLTVGGADIVFSVSFENPNPYPLLVDRLNYVLKFGDARVAAGSFSGDKSIPENGEKTFSLPMLLDFFEIGEGLRDAFVGSEVPCDFSGSIEVPSIWGRLILPFEVKVNLPLQKTPAP